MHAVAGTWWARVVTFILRDLCDILRSTCLYNTVGAIQFGNSQSNYHFFAMLEMYDSISNTLFTPIGELGFALHEMHEVSGLSLGEMFYEEYIPTAEALHILKKESPGVYDTYWEVLCHYYICCKIQGSGTGVFGNYPGPNTCSKIWKRMLFMCLVFLLAPTKRLRIGFQNLFQPTSPTLLKTLFQVTPSSGASITKLRIRYLAGLCWRVS